MFQHVNTSIVRVDSALHVTFHINALELIALEIVFNGAQAAHC